VEQRLHLVRETTVDVEILHRVLVGLDKRHHRAELAADQVGEASQDVDARLAGAPGEQLVEGLAEIVGQAPDDVFLGAEVVVQRGFRHVQPLGDLTQRGLLVSLVDEEFQRDLLDPLASVTAPTGHFRPS